MNKYFKLIHKIYFNEKDSLLKSIYFQECGNKNFFKALPMQVQENYKKVKDYSGKT